MDRLWRIAVFAVAVVVMAVTFAPVGAWLGERAYDLYASMRETGTRESTAALVPLLAVDVVALLVTFGASFVGGVRLPSGLPHVFFGVFFPLALGAMQARFFELSGDPGNLATSFGTWNFLAMFALCIALAQVGVHVSRQRHERRRL